MTSRAVEPTGLCSKHAQACMQRCKLLLTAIAADLLLLLIAVTNCCDLLLLRIAGTNCCY